MQSKQPKLPRSIGGRRIRAWHAKKVVVPKVGEQAHGREVIGLLPGTLREPLVRWMSTKSEGVCTVSRWKTFKREGEDYTDKNTRGGWRSRR